MANPDINPDGGDIVSVVQLRVTQCSLRKIRSLRNVPPPQINKLGE